MPITNAEARHIARTLTDAGPLVVLAALAAIAESAMDPDANGNDTAETAYSVLARLGLEI
jgi:hypothetical protein